MARILETGAAGFIGFHLVRALAARGDSVVAVDNFVRGERDAAFVDLIGQPGVKWIEADLSREADVARLPTDVD